MGLLLWGFAYSGCEDRPSMQYIPQKNIKSATAAFADSLLIVCYELSYPHFMERRGSLYFSSEHTAYSPVNLGYLCEAIYYEFINHVRGCRNALPKLTLHLLYSVWNYAKGRVKKLRFSHALHNVITYEIISFYKGTLVILTGLPAQHLMAILCDKYHDFPLG